MLRTRWAIGTALLTALATAPLLRAYRAVDPTLRRPGLTVDISVRGPRTLALLRRVSEGASPVADGVEATPHTATGPGATVPVIVHVPAERGAHGGALLWIHGGGLVSGSAAAANAFCSGLAAETGAVVVAVDHRLAPEHPFPAPLDDCHTAFGWLVARAESLGVDPDRIAVGGASAGGGIAAALCQRLRDEDGPQPGFQLLRYPMLDDRTALLHDRRRHFVWSARSNRFGWTSYLGRPPRAADAPAYAAAARTEDLAGLPPAWIGVGSADLFHDESRAYAERLTAAGVPVDLHVVPGMYHGADGAAAQLPLMQDFTARETSALRSALAH